MINSIIRFFAKGGLWILLFTAVYKFTFLIIESVSFFKAGGDLGTGLGVSTLIGGIFDLTVMLSALTIVTVAAKKLAKDLPPVIPHNPYLPNNYNQGMPNGQYPQQYPNQQTIYPQQAPMQQQVPVQQMPQAPVQQAPVQQVQQMPVQQVQQTPVQQVQQTPIQQVQQTPVQQEPAAASSVWFCPSCGTQNPGDNAFCSVCGMPK